MAARNKEKTKILYIITKSNFGGAQRYVFDLATSLPWKGFDVAVAPGGAGLLKEKLARAGVRTITIPSLTNEIEVLGSAKALIALIKLFLRERPDIIHLNSTKVGFVGALAARIYNSLPATSRQLLATRQRPATIIFTAHGWAFNEERSFFIKKLLLLAQWLTVLLCHRSIAVSFAIKNRVAHMPFVRRKIVVVRNGIAPIEFMERSAARAEILRRYRARAAQGGAGAADEFWIGTISELHPNKGLAHAIEAINLLTENYPSLLFVIIGEGQEKRRLKQLIKQKGLERNVFLAGYIDNAAQNLKAFDIFTLTSITEALAYAVLEAGAARLPVVASDVGGVPEIIKNKKSGILVKPRDTAAIARAIRHLISHPQKRNECGENLHEKVRQSFTREKMVKNTVNIYRENRK